MPTPLPYRAYYHRYLPHYQPPEVTLFVTFRLHGSLPVEVIDRLRSEAKERKGQIDKMAAESDRRVALYTECKRQFGRFDEALDVSPCGPTWLKDPRIASIVVEALLFRDQKVYELDCFTIMSNHVHAVFAPLVDETGACYGLSRIMQSLKRHTASSANELLGREGVFWQPESYDHVVRDEGEWQRIVWYVLNNPVKVGLVRDWREWPWTYFRYKDMM
ncbi:transposase [Promineifilum sp.]|uniref:transposase n=1 Tax=Promineifilum sp. TaxID=2664178 RepID=UPI0035B0A26C